MICDSMMKILMPVLMVRVNYPEASLKSSV